MHWAYIWLQIIKWNAKAQIHVATNDNFWELIFLYWPRFQEASEGNIFWEILPALRYSLRADSHSLYLPQLPQPARAKQNTKYTNENSKYTNQNTKCEFDSPMQCCFTLLCRDTIFVANFRTLRRTFYRPKKYGGVPKMTNIKYAGSVQRPVEWWRTREKYKFGRFSSDACIASRPSWELASGFSSNISNS